MHDAVDERERVRGRIAPLVLDFLRRTTPAEWRMRDLVAYVAARTAEYVAPDSPSRILRALAADGLVEYRVVNRRASLYTARVLPAQRSLAL